MDRSSLSQASPTMLALVVLSIIIPCVAGIIFGVLCIKAFNISTYNLRKRLFQSTIEAERLKTFVAEAEVYMLPMHVPLGL